MFPNKDPLFDYLVVTDKLEEALGNKKKDSKVKKDIKLDKNKKRKSKKRQNDIK